MTQSSPPVKYDISTDSMSPVTQEDWDKQQAIIYSLWQRVEGLAPGEQPTIPQGLRLAVFPNRMREGEVFIAEDKKIEPLKDENGTIVYAGVFTEQGLEQRPYFPPTPETKWVIDRSVNEVFASELVRRWNLQAEEQAKEQAKDYIGCSCCFAPLGEKHWADCAYEGLTNPYVVASQCHKIKAGEQEHG